MKPLDISAPAPRTLDLILTPRARAIRCIACFPRGT